MKNIWIIQKFKKNPYSKENFIKGESSFFNSKIG